MKLRCFITWLGMVYNNYWTRVVVAGNPDTAQQDLQLASDDAIAALERLIARHGELSRQRPQPGN